MNLQISFIIPVFNRPDEIDELLNSFSKLNTTTNFEIVIIEDGSNLTAEEVVNKYQNQLDILYLFKDNSGPGDSRNYGMKHAKGNYFIILDSDCILPSEYLNEVAKSLHEDFVHCFGGPDAAHESFSYLQKAINYSMTSFLTTGGIRGNKKSMNRFQPRSFNMGLSKEAFLKTKGFGKIHPGEDPDLTIRLWKLGYKTKLISKAFVFHKRRISWSKFYRQVNKFGLVRPILNLWHPETKKITYWFPTIFVLGFFAAIILLVSFQFKWLFDLYLLYYLIVFIHAIIKTKNIYIAILSLCAINIQFMGYGLGFLKSTVAIQVFNKKPKEYFPELFF
ncbi:glycosyltransferase family 2 protein [Xanthomarina sp. GH4-25]|uniref:glycosyltransferase n=1 Tax=Xanthomarina sp. GH4-25 TaxID=3349335 RepID=UPI000D680A6F|nr:glycosyl transferase family 2 [Flavobacteriaceae bacterium LYZ1037]